VEFAIVLPVLLLFVMGILEFSFVMRDYLGVQSAVSVGARIAATGAGSGAVTSCPTPPDGCHVGDPNLVDAAAKAIKQAGTAMPKDNIDEIWIFQANNWGWPTNSNPVSTSTPAYNNLAMGAQNQTDADLDGCVTACIQFHWSDVYDRFIWVGGTWESWRINACLNPTASQPPSQSVGVYLKATHPFITRLFGISLPVTGRSVFKFEPLQYKECNGLGTSNGGHL
jgi:hypothetical protein